MTKEDILAHCLTSVAQRIQEVTFAIKDADQALADDTKSSAGDKYETSREMVQQDISRYQKQLAVANVDLQVLQKIEPLQSSEHVRIGSLVATDKGLYFISISIGLVKVANNSVFVISSVSPIGQVLMGKGVGDTFTFNNIQQQIVTIS